MDVRRQRAYGEVESRLSGKAVQKLFRGIRPSAQGARENGDRRQCSMHANGRHKVIQMDAEECPPLGLGGGARAFIKALSEGSGDPAFVLYSVTQIGTPHGGFVLLQHLIKDALDGRLLDVQVRPAESAWKRFGVDCARAVAHTFQEILPRALPGACRVLKVRRWAAKTVPWMGVEDAE